jgi:hypothetical protein
MSALAHQLNRYLTIRRSFGFDLVTDARVLRRFVAFAECQDAPYITTDLFLKWKAAFGNAGQATWAARFGMVRLFAQWLNGFDPNIRRNGSYQAGTAEQGPIFIASRKSPGSWKKPPDFPRFMASVASPIRHCSALLPIRGFASLSNWSQQWRC